MELRFPRVALARLFRRAARMGGRTACALAIAVWAGMALAGAARCDSAARAKLAGALACAGAALLPFAAAARGDRQGSAALLAAAALLGAGRAAGHEAALVRAREALARGGAFHRVTGRLAEPPALEAGEGTVRVTLARATFAAPAGTSLRLRLPAGAGGEWGERFRALVRIESPERASVPGGFDALAFADGRGLAASGRAVWIERERAGGLPAFAAAGGARLRRALERRFALALDPATRELVTPLVTGDRSAMTTALTSDLRAAGLLHLLALSGLHVAWLAAVARGAVALLGGGLVARAIAGSACALAYVAIAGPLPSLARAAAGEMLLGWALARDRALDPLQALALTALALLGAAPGWAGDLGFQLSCAATFGLAAFAPHLTRALARAPLLGGLLAPTLGAQLASLPLLLARFHALPWTGLLTNLAAVPLAGLLLSAAWIGASLEIAWPGAGRAYLAACEPLAFALREVTAWGARLPGAMLATGAAPGIPICAALGAALLAAGLASARAGEARRVGRPRVAAFALLAGGVLTASALLCAALARPLAPPPGRWWLVVLDVGQGDALALAFRDGWWLVDAGPRSPRWDAGEGVVLPFFRWAGVRRLETLALTHDDGDHTGGAAAVGRALEVRRRLGPLDDPRPGRGDVLHVSPRVRVLWPPRAGERDTALAASDNARGLVLEAGAGVSRALLLADVDSTVEERLEAERGASVLKAAHHGSASSSGAGFLARLRPRIAAISCGRHNPFGHPAAAALERLGAAGAKVLRTDRLGTLWFEFGPDSARLLDWRAGEPWAGAAPARVRPPASRRP